MELQIVATAGHLIFDNNNGELIVNPYPRNWSKEKIKFHEDMKAIESAAKKYGVVGFLREVKRLKLPIKKHGKSTSLEILHTVYDNRFWFEFGTGKYIN